MYFERKIDADLDNWIKKEKHHPALLVGIRQCGKTETVREFAKRNRLRLIEMNFWTHPEYSADFDGDLEVDAIVSNIALRFPKQSIDPEKTILFF